MSRVPPPEPPHPREGYACAWSSRTGVSWHEVGELVDSERARDALRDLVECACAAQHVANINLGRWGVSARPRGWVLARRRARQGDAWEYRRALELAALLDEGLLAELIARGRDSDDPEIRAAAAEDWS